MRRGVEGSAFGPEGSARPADSVPPEDSVAPEGSARESPAFRPGPALGVVAVVRGGKGNEAR